MIHGFCCLFINQNRTALKFFNTSKAIDALFAITKDHRLVNRHNSPSRRKLREVLPYGILFRIDRKALIFRNREWI